MKFLFDIVIYDFTIIYKHTGILKSFINILKRGYIVPRLSNRIIFEKFFYPKRSKNSECITIYIVTFSVKIFVKKSYSSLYERTSIKMFENYRFAFT